MESFDNLTWRKSVRSGSSSNCVELASLSGRIAARDSKRPTQNPITVDRATWSRFARNVKGGEFDLT